MEIKREDFKKFRIVNTLFYALPVDFFEKKEELINTTEGVMTKKEFEAEEARIAKELEEEKKALALAEKKRVAEEKVKAEEEAKLEEERITKEKKDAAAAKRKATLEAKKVAKLKELEELKAAKLLELEALDELKEETEEE